MSNFYQIFYPIVSCMRNPDSKRKQDIDIINELKSFAESLGTVSKDIFDQTLTEVGKENNIDPNYAPIDKILNKLEDKYIDLAYFFSQKDITSNCYVWYDGIDQLDFRRGVPLSDKDVDILYSFDAKLKDYCLSIASKNKECKIMVINILIWYKKDPLLIT